MSTVGLIHHGNTPANQLLATLDEHFSTVESDVGTRQGRYRSSTKLADSPIALVIDGEGAAQRLRWVLPTTSRGSASPLADAQFDLPAPIASSADRGIAGAVMGRVVKLLVPQLVDATAAAVTRTLARAWEERRTTEMLRMFNPDSSYLSASEAGALALSKLDAGPTLVLIPDVLGSVRSSFATLAGLPMLRLQHTYQDRVVGFEHFTLSKTPRDNAEDLARLLDEVGAPQIDVLAHGRGGLVARELLAREPSGVSCVVTAGTPHLGTPLCDPTRLVDFLNRATDVLDLLPAAGVEDVVSTVLSIAGVLAKAAAEGLPGLTAMAPSDERLVELRAKPNGAQVRMAAFSSDFRGRKSGGALGAAAVWLTNAGIGGSNDGLVPVDSATAKGLTGFYRGEIGPEAEVAHGDYFGRAEVLDALVGAHTRSAQRSSSSATQRVGVEIPELAPSQLDVTVVHEGLEYASFPLLIGSFANAGLHSTQLVLDDRLEGRLSALHHAGAFPGRLGESRFLLNHDGIGYPPGAYIVGLGDEGDLDRERLAFTVRQAVLHRCLELLDDPTMSSSAVVGVSSLLLGSAYSTGMSIADSVLAIIDGVVRANAALEGYQHSIGADRSVRVGALEFVERAADRAENAVRVVRGAAEQLALPSDTFDFSSVTLLSRRDCGGMPASLPIDPTDTKEVQLSVLSRSASEDGELRVDVTLLGRDARIDARSHSIDVAVVDEITARLPNDPDLATTLFDLLIPQEFEQRMSFSAPIELIVDQRTANIPWELLSAPIVGNRRGALSNVGGIVRRFSESKTSRLAPRRPTTDSAMVVAAGRVAGEAPLPGVLREAAVVSAIFANGFGIDVEPLTDELNPLDRVVFMEQLLSEKRFIHIASHGTFEDDGKTAAALLGSGLRLTPDLVSKIRVVPEIVFLNCCQLAGIGSRRFAPGMARELMGIGVRAVIAAGWNISDDAAVGFAGAFWSAMSDGDSLRQAVLEARRTASTYGGGTTWAAYQCYGDPSLRVRVGGRRSPTRAARPASTDDLIRNLDALAIRATDVRPRHPADVYQQVMILRGEFARLRTAAREYGHADNPDVQRRLGVAARQLGLFGAAADAYRAVIARPGSEHGLDLEQLANVEARFAQRRALEEADESDLVDDDLLNLAPAKLFRIAEKRVRQALHIAESRERYALLGSVYKKWATVDERRRPQLARKSYESYRKAAELAADAGYGLENARQLAALIGEQPPEVPDDASTVKRSRPLLIDERPLTTDFWGLAAHGDERLTELLRTDAKGIPPGLREAAARAYRQAFATRSSASERDSVFAHLKDLAWLTPADDPRRHALDDILDALKEWNPWGAPEAETQATGTATASRSVERASTDLALSMFPAGPGDALLIEWGPRSDRSSMLVDGGLVVDPDAGLGRYLATHRSPPFVDILVVSHIDADHVQGAIDAVGALELTYGDVWFNGTSQLISDRSIAQGFQFDSLTLGENRNPMTGGKAIVVPDQGPLPTTKLAHGATVTFLSPDSKQLERLGNAWRKAIAAGKTRGSKGAGTDFASFVEELGEDTDETERGEPSWGSDSSVPNGSSIAFLFEYGDSALLFTGDAYASVLEQSLIRLLVERRQNRLRLDVFKTSHHGSARNITAALLDLIDCAHFFVSTDGSRHGHPNPPTIELIRGKHPAASIHLNYDNDDVRGRAGDSEQVVYPTGTGPTVFNG